jgi:outer membrane murein-binding lipoprotein Lpp
VLVASVVVAGCSSTDSKNDYIEAVNEIQVTAIDTFNQTVNATSGQPDEQAEQLAAAQTTYDEVISELESVEVPEEAQAGHEDLIAGFKELRAVFDDSLAQVKKADDPAEAFDAINALGTEGAAVAQSIDQALSQIRSDLE